MASRAPPGRVGSEIAREGVRPQSQSQGHAEIAGNRARTGSKSSILTTPALHNE